MSKLLPRSGAVAGLFLAFYGLFRIALENVREPDRDMPHFPLGLTMGIMLSVPMLLAGLSLIWWSSRPEALAQGWQPSLDEGEEDLGEADTTLADIAETPSDTFAAATPEPLKPANP